MPITAIGDERLSVTFWLGAMPRFHTCGNALSGIPLRRRMGVRL